MKPTKEEDLEKQKQILEDTTKLLIRRDVELHKINEELEKEKQAITAERDKLEIVLSGVSDAVISLDLDRKIITFNKAAQDLTSYSLEEVVNKPIDEIIKVYDNIGEISPLNYCPISLDTQEGITFNKQEVKIVSNKNKTAYVNIMAGQIKAAHKTNLGCILTLHDVTKEKELEQMKIDFVSVTTHELRTPLTAIKGYLSVFIQENQAKLGEEQNLFLTRMNIATQQLGALIDNILSISRIEEGALTVKVEPVDWLTIINDIYDDFTNLAEERKINYSFQKPAQEIPKIMADKLRIGEVLANLISNAINYTPKGGLVTVFIEVNDQEVITHVKDNGPGIPEYAIPHLFTKFFRVAGVLEQGSKGTGLGLYISKTIVEKHKGKIWVESQEGKGSTFSFSIPRA